MRAVFGLIAYLLIAFVAFGDILRPVDFMTWLSDRLPYPGWRLFVLLVMILSYLCLIPQRSWLNPDFKFAIFVIFSMTISIVSIGFYVDWQRHQRIITFNADDSFEHSIFRSIREAPAEPQFYLHAAAVKDCTIYGWSYRTMGFYELPPAVDRMGPLYRWKKRCDRIEREGLEHMYIPKK